MKVADMVEFEDREDLMTVRRLHLVVHGSKGKTYVVIQRQGPTEVRLWWTEWPMGYIVMCS